MPKVNVEIDTDNETMVVKFGDEVVEGASYLCVSIPEHDAYYKMSVSVHKMEESEDGVKKMTMYSVSSLDETKKLIEKGEMTESKKYKGFAESQPQYPIMAGLADFVGQLMNKSKGKK